jgi:hypothetical protein
VVRCLALIERIDDATDAAYARDGVQQRLHFSMQNRSAQRDAAFVDLYADGVRMRHGSTKLCSNALD